MKTTEMKEILVNKFIDEGCYFRKKDVSIKKVATNKYKIVIKDYEHITFYLKVDYDDYFGNEIFIYSKYEDEFGEVVTHTNTKHNLEYKDYAEALKKLGYYIAIRF